MADRIETVDARPVKRLLIDIITRDNGLVAAIVDLHGFSLEVGASELGGARLVLHCPLAGLPGQA